MKRIRVVLPDGSIVNELLEIRKEDASIEEILELICNTFKLNSKEHEVLISAEGKINNLEATFIHVVEKKCYRWITTRRCKECQ